MLNAPDEYRRMAEVEESLWWYRSLHDLALRTLRKLSISRDARIVDAGCGTGGLLTRLAADGYRNTAGFDLSALAVDHCHRRGFDVRQSDVRRVAELFPPASVDVFVSNDVFCYLDRLEQRAVTNHFFDILNPGGRVILNLPALKAFSGSHDISVGIRQRFSSADLEQIFDGDRFTIEKTLYWPFVLSPLIFAVRAYQRHKLRRGTASPTSDIDLPNPLLNELFYRLTAAENGLLPAKPFGSSLFVVARRH